MVNKELVSTEMYQFAHLSALERREGGEHSQDSAFKNSFLKGQMA